jgi:cytochrome c oxidase subunit II
MRRKPRAISFLLVLALTLLAASPAFAGNGGIAPVEPESPNASSISTTYWLILAITGAVFLIVETALVVFLIRFRRGHRSRTAEGPQIRGHSNLELLWTAVPVLIVAAIVGFVFAELPDIKNVPPASAGDSLSVRVDAHQYYWLFEYPDGQVSIDEMQVPVDKVVTLTVVSSDVVHSWWIPALGGKIDAVPGRTNHTWFQARSLGTYHGQCAELCGLLHADMRATVRVVSEQQFRSFLTAHAPSSQTVAAETFEGVCAKCHGPQGQGDIGPPLQNRTFETGDITDLLRSGRGAMPAVGNDWSQAQLDATIAYLNATKGGATLGR